jgi:D-alanyl-D-alanine carboxypeptidase
LIDEILLVNAIPGYSEHHTGRALDLHAGDGKPLETAFENHPAFSWLCDHAAEFNFHLSYPRGNPDGINYEPWHWCFSTGN